MTKVNPNLKTVADYIGLSSDEKPITDVVDGSTFFEVDTATGYIFYEGAWWAL